MQALLLFAALCAAGELPKPLGKPAIPPPEAAPVPDQRRFIDLTRVDFDQRPELARYVPLLEGTFQVLTKDPDKKGVAVPEKEGGPGLFAQCTFSYLGEGRVAGAGHCLWRHEGDFADSLVLRRHHFEVRGGRLVRTGYRDYRLAQKAEPGEADVVLLTLEGTRPPEDVAFSHGKADAASVDILGYPNHLYGVPYLSIGCAISEPRRGTYAHDCSVVPGMSGGPQFAAPRAQVGVTSQPGVGVFLPPRE